MLKLNNFFKKNENKFYHLSEFLIEKIFFTYLVIFLIITGFQLIIGYNAEKKSIKKEVNEYINKDLPYINQSLFYKNNFLLKDSLSDLAERDVVSQIVLVDKNQNKIFYFEKKKFEDSIYNVVVTKDLVHNSGSFQGKIIVTSDYNIIIKKLIGIFFQILFTNIIIFISLAITVYLFSKKFLVKPLVNFSNELRDLSSQEIMPMVNENDTEVDEIHKLKNTTNIFIQEIFVLKESYKLLIDDLMEKYEQTMKQNHDLEEEVKDKEKEIIQKEYKFQSIFEQSNVPIALTDLEGNIVKCNKSYCKFLEYDLEKELKGVNFSELTHPEDIEIQQVAFKELLSGNGLNKRMEKRYLTKNKNILWADVTFTEIFDEKNKIINLVIILIDITKKKKYEAEIEKLYNLALDANALTGLPGNNTIRKHIEDSIESRANYAILYADLDHFKAYNDRYGFVKGDNIILHTAKIFEYVSKELKLESFFIGHIGGDDFVILIPSDKVDDYVQLVISDFETSIKTFYNQEDYELGYISSYDRDGNLKKYPFISVSITGVDLTKSNYTSYLEINDVLTLGKKKAKNIDGNSFYLIEPKID